jgi:hypothetical protein
MAGEGSLSGHRRGNSPTTELMKDVHSIIMDFCYDTYKGVKRADFDKMSLREQKVAIGYNQEVPWYTRASHSIQRRRGARTNNHTLASNVYKNAKNKYISGELDYLRGVKEGRIWDRLRFSEYKFDSKYKGMLPEDIKKIYDMARGERGSWPSKPVTRTLEWLDNLESESPGFPIIPSAIESARKRLEDLKDKEGEVVEEKRRRAEGMERMRENYRARELKELDGNTNFAYGGTRKSRRHRARKTRRSR